MEKEDVPGVRIAKPVLIAPCVSTATAEEAVGYAVADPIEIHHHQVETGHILLHPAAKAGCPSGLKFPLKETLKSMLMVVIRGPWIATSPEVLPDAARMVH